MFFDRWVISAACVAAGLALTSCAQMQAPVPPPNKIDEVRGALSGTKQAIGHFYNLNPDCTTGGYPTIKITMPPQHGQISVEQGTAFADFPKDNIRSACNGKSVPATVVYYNSAPGYVGSDEAYLERIGVAGGYGFYDYTINVR